MTITANTTDNDVAEQLYRIISDGPGRNVLRIPSAPDDIDPILALIKTFFDDVLLGYLTLIGPSGHRVWIARDSDYLDQVQKLLAHTGFVRVELIPRTKDPLSPF